MTSRASSAASQHQSMCLTDRAGKTVTRSSRNMSTSPWESVPGSTIISRAGAKGIDLSANLGGPISELCLGHSSAGSHNLHLVRTLARSAACSDRLENKEGDSLPPKVTCRDATATGSSVSPSVVMTLCSADSAWRCMRLHADLKSNFPMRILIIGKNQRRVTFAWASLRSVNPYTHFDSDDGMTRWFTDSIVSNS